MSIHLLTRNVGQGSKEYVFTGDSLMNLRTSLWEKKSFFSKGTHFDAISEIARVFLILLILSIKSPPNQLASDFHQYGMEG